MSSIELKNKVFQELETVDDYILEEILSLIQIETTPDKLIKIRSIIKKLWIRVLLKWNPETLFQTGLLKTKSNSGFTNNLDTRCYSAF